MGRSKNGKKNEVVTIHCCAFQTMDFEGPFFYDDLQFGRRRGKKKAFYVHRLDFSTSSLLASVLLSFLHYLIIMVLTFCVLMLMRLRLHFYLCYTRPIADLEKRR